MDCKKIFDNIDAFCNAVKQGIENASFEDRRKIIELLVEEVIVTNGKVEIVHIIPLEKNANLQLHGRNWISRKKRFSGKNHNPTLYYKNVLFHGFSNFIQFLAAL